MSIDEILYGQEVPFWRFPRISEETAKKPDGLATVYDIAGRVPSFMRNLIPSDELLDYASFYMPSGAGTASLMKSFTGISLQKIRIIEKEWEKRSISALDVVQNADYWNGVFNDWNSDTDDPMERHKEIVKEIVADVIGVDIDILIPLLKKIKKDREYTGRKKIVTRQTIIGYFAKSDLGLEATSPALFRVNPEFEEHSDWVAFWHNGLDLFGKDTVVCGSDLYPDSYPSYRFKLAVRNYAVPCSQVSAYLFASSISDKGNELIEWYENNYEKTIQG